MKYYVRDGSRFIKTSDLYGMYANTDGSFTSRKVSNSYGVVVIHNFKEIVIAHLAVVSNKTWHEAKKGYKLPSRLQLMAAFELKDMFDQRSGVFWTNEEEYVDEYAWALRWPGGGVYNYGKNYYGYIREFTTIKL